MKDFLEQTLFHIGKNEITVLSILLVILLIIVVKIVLWLIKKSIDNASRIEVSKKYAVYNLVKYVIIVLSITAAFQILDFKFT